MKKLTILVSCFVLHASCFTLSAAVRHFHAVTVAEGESAVMSAEHALEVRTGNPSVAATTLRENEVSVLGTGIGNTDIFFSDSRGLFGDARVTVVPSYWSVLQRLFADDPEISIEIVGGRVVLSGSTASADTLKRVAEAKALDEARIIAQVSYSPEALQVIVQDFVNRSGATNITVTAIGREVCLNGKVFDLASAKALGERVKTFLSDFPQVIVNWENLRVYRQKIVLDIEFVDWNDTRAENLGMKLSDALKVTVGEGDLFGMTYDWTRDHSTESTRGSEYTTPTTSTDASGTTTTSGGLTRNSSHTRQGTKGRNTNLSFGNSSLVKSDGLSVTLNMAKNNGVARTTYHTQLATQSGEQVNFKNGGTMYVRTLAGANAAGDLTTFDYGYNITAMPVIFDPETLNLDFDIDYSSLDNAAQVENGDYSIKRYQTKSKYVLRPGETIVLSGFNSRTESVGKDGIPFLSRIPGLSWLFGNTQRSNNKVDTLLVVKVDWAIEDSDAAKAQLKEITDRKVDVEMP